LELGYYRPVVPDILLTIIERCAAEVQPGDATICNYCGTVIEDSLAPCPALDEGICRP
jgi:hypothetical protein